VLLALPFLGAWMRRTNEPCCALDGGALAPSYQVRIEDTAGVSHEFCCIRCAELWLDQNPQRAYGIWVTDESSGSEVLAADAQFVRSLVVTTATTGNRIHAFREWADAERHANKCRGTILTGSERPFTERN
jgi:hypothetical protein